MSTQTIRPHRPSIRWLALAGIIGPALFIMTVIAIGARQDGYSHVWQAISELGGVEAQYPVLQNVNFLMMGFSMLVLAWALYESLGGPLTGPALLAFFGLAGGIAQGLLPCDIACRGETPVGLLHNVTGVAGFVAAITGMLVFARRWQLDETWRLHARFTRLAAVLAVTAFISFILVSALMPSGPRGLVQRIFVGTLLVWLMVTSWRLWNRPSAVPRERVSA
jgi:hypothetical protein